MKRILYTTILYILTLSALSAQQQYYDWFISAGAGGMGYSGDLSYKLRSAKVNLPAYQVAIGRSISPSLAITLQGTYGQISANDRAKDWNGNWQTNNPNFSRALNFQTDIRSASLLLSYRLNNGSVLSKHALVAPYFYGGVGVTNFTVFGDLYTEAGERYYYWSDNTIRNQAEQTGASNTARVIKQDGKFETNLSTLITEQAYPTTVWSIPVGLGVKIRISDRVSANLQAGASYAFSGYLDDVKGAHRNDFSTAAQAYAANPSGISRNTRGNNQHDLYLTAFLSLAYHFNGNKKKFQAPMVYTGYKPTQVIAYTTPADDTDAELADEPLPSSTENKLEIKSLEPLLPVLKKPVAKQNKTVAEEADSKTSRHTVDINLRVIVEGGKATVDTVTIPISQTKPDTTLSVHTLNRTQTSNLETITQNISETDTLNRTNNLSVPGERYLPANSRRADTLSPVREKQQTNQPLSPARDNSLRSEFNQMRRELDSLKLVQQAAPGTNRLNPALQPDRQMEPASSLKTLPQDQATARISALQQEVTSLRNEMEREKRMRNYATQSPEIIRDSRINDNYRRTYTGPSASVPLVVEKNNYNKEDMAALRKEVTTIQQQLEALRAQQKIEKDTLVDTRIDSLVNLINRIESPDSMPAGNMPATNSIPVQTDDRQTEQMIDSLRKQIASVNQSLLFVQAAMAEEMDSLLAGVPLSALGSTAIYYDVNAAQLTSSDKQRLSVLGQIVKSGQSVIIHIKGFTDQSGNAAYNLILSRKRAENVKNYFVSQMGIDTAQILINYFGQQKSSPGKENPYDRRVEVELFR